MNGPPELIAIEHDDYHAEYIGIADDGQQFFLTTPFAAATPNGSDCEYVALFLFAPSGEFIEAKIDAFGPRNSMDKAARDRCHDQRMKELGDVQFQRIEVKPFSTDFEGVEFGLIPRPPEDPEDEDDHWWVELEPGNYMAFAPPWDSGDYDT
jgi:hypothetical protein